MIWTLIWQLLPRWALSTSVHWHLSLHHTKRASIRCTASALALQAMYGAMLAHKQGYAYL